MWTQTQSDQKLLSCMLVISVYRRTCFAPLIACWGNCVQFSKFFGGRVQFIHSLVIIHSQSVILVFLICSHKIVGQTKCPTTEDVSPQIYLSTLASLLEFGGPLSLFCSVPWDIMEAEIPCSSGLSLSLPTQAQAGVQGPRSTGVTNRLLRNAAPHRRMGKQVPGSRCHSHQISRTTRDVLL